MPLTYAYTAIRDDQVPVGVEPLMQHALAEAAGRGKDAVWLAVWEHNARARRFYEQWDFHPAGTQPFLLGTDVQTDLVMVRRIARES